MTRFEHNMRTFSKENLGLRLVEFHGIIVPPASFKEKTVYISTIFRLHIRFFLQEIKVINNLIDRNSVPSGKVLKDTCQETLSEEEP